MKRTEAALRQTEAKCRVLFETMPQGVIFLNHAGRVLEANSAAERILGFSFEQLQQRNLLAPLGQAITETGADFPAQEQPAMIALTTGQEVYGVIMGIQTPQKKGPTWIRVNAIPQFQPSETKPYQVYMTIDDITTEKNLP
jgi:PAS domain S-box-containing protein